MNLRSLRTLVEIDRLGSFAAVAARLGVPLSTVSVQMKTLEAELQFALFDRTHRPPAMTPAARQVAERARVILAEVETVRAIGQEAGDLRGVFRVGFVGTASVRLLPGFLANAGTRYPKAQFVIEGGLSTDLLARVLAGDLDAAILTETDDAPPSVRFRTLRREAFALTVPARAKGWGLDRCAAELPLVKFMPSTGIGALVDAYFNRRGIAVRERVVLDSVEAVMGCINAGLGFAIIPEPDACRYASEAEVSVLSSPPLHRRVGLAVNANSPAARHARTLAALFAPPEPGERAVID